MKKLSVFSFFSTGIFWIICGLILLIWRSSVTLFFTQLLIIYLITAGFWQLFRFFQKLFSSNESQRKPIGILLISVAHFVAALILINNRALPTVLLVQFIGVYQLIMGIISLIQYLILVRDRVKPRLGQLVETLVHFFFGVSSLFSSTPIRNTLLRLGVYLILIGLSIFLDWRAEMEASPDKRRLAIALPPLVTVFLPHSTIRRINQFLTATADEEVNSTEDSPLTHNNPTTYSYEYPQMPDAATNTIKVFIHVGEKGFDRVGHVDIGYEGKVYTYGNFDIESRILYDTVGDGVLFVADEARYFDFQLSNNTTVFVYTVALTEDQDKAFRLALQDLKKQLIPWQLSTDNHWNDYIGKVVTHTGAKLYKFSKGIFKTYFIFGTNCVLLSDELIGRSGINIVQIMGMLSPGTYYDYFEREWRKPNSWVTSRYIINQQLEDTNLLSGN